MLRLVVLHLLFGAAAVGGLFLLPEHAAWYVDALYCVIVIPVAVIGPSVLAAFF